jgi:hypothetical protein
MPDRDVPAISPKLRDALFTKLKDDPKFRDAMKKDWREAVQQMKIKPEAIAKGVLSRREIEDFLGQRAGWVIEIVISARVPGAERVQVAEAVNFEAR